MCWSFGLSMKLMKQLYLSLPKIIKIINAIRVFKHCVSFSALQLSQLTPVTLTLLIMHSAKIIKTPNIFGNFSQNKSNKQNSNASLHSYVFKKYLA